MNFENMNLLSQKVESVLGTVRALREENAKLKQLLEGKDAQAEDQKNLLDSANAKIADYEAAVKAAEEGKGAMPAKPSDEIYALAKHPIRHNIPTKKFIMDVLSQMTNTAELYGIFTFMALSFNNAPAAREAPLTALIEQGRGVALGGKLNDYDFLGVGSSMPSQSRSAALPAGSGYLVTDAGIASIRVPLADSDED